MCIYLFSLQTTHLNVENASSGPMNAFFFNMYYIITMNMSYFVEKKGK